MSRMLPTQPRAKSNVIPAGVNYQSHVHAHKLSTGSGGKGKKANQEKNELQEIPSSCSEGVGEHDIGVLTLSATATMTTTI